MKVRRSISVTSAWTAGLWVTIWGILGLGMGLLIGWRALPLLWPLALALMAAWLARWPRPSVGLLAVTFGVILASPFAREYEPPGPQPSVRVVSSTPESTRNWAGVEALSVRNSNGDIAVTGGRVWRLETRYRWGAQVRGIPEELLVARRGRVLDFTGLEPTWSQEPLRGAIARLRANMPHRAGLSVDARSGNVMARNLASAHVETNLGDVTLSNIAGAAVALTDVGNVLITDAGGGIEAETQIGDIWLEPRFTTQNTAAPILAQADVGDVALVLPPGVDARIVATSVSRGLPANFTRSSPTQGELVLGNGSRLIVLSTRIGNIELVQR